MNFSSGKYLHYLLTGNSNKNIYIINNINTETLANERMIPSGGLIVHKQKNGLIVHKLKNRPSGNNTNVGYLRIPYA